MKYFTNNLKFLLISIFIANSLYSQFPGGVNTNLSRWYKGENISESGGLVTEWNNGFNPNTNGNFTVPNQNNLGLIPQTGNAPFYADNYLNFNPGIEFQDVALRGKQSTNNANAFMPNGNSSRATFIVFDPNSIVPIGGGGPDNLYGLYGYGSSVSGSGNRPQYDAHMSLFNSTQYRTDLNYEQARVIIAGQEIGTPSIFSTTYTQGNAISNTYSNLNGGDGDETGNSTSCSGSQCSNEPNTNNSISNKSNILLGNNSGTNTTKVFTGGRVLEFIVYNNNDLSTVVGSGSATQLDLVQSYLAVKYGFTLNQEESRSQIYYNSSADTIWSNASGGFDNRIFGIARDDSSELNQRISKSNETDAVMILNADATDFTSSNLTSRPAALNDLDYVMVSSNTGDVDVAVPNANLGGDNSFNRVWKLRQSGVADNNTGCINIGFDLSSVTTTLGAGQAYFINLGTNSDLSGGVEQFKLTKQGLQISIALV